MVDSVLVGGLIGGLILTTIKKDITTYAVTIPIIKPGTTDIIGIVFFESIIASSEQNALDIANSLDSMHTNIHKAFAKRNKD